MRGPVPSRARGLGSSLAARLLIGAGGLVLAAFSAADALVNVVHYTKPEVALAIDADDPAALAARADEIIAEEGVDRVANPRIVALAKQSLTSQALNADAMRLIGLARSVTDQKAAAAAFAVGDRLGRRDLTTQLCSSNRRCSSRMSPGRCATMTRRCARARKVSRCCFQC